MVTWLVAKRGAGGPVSGTEGYRAALVSQASELANMPFSPVWTTAVAIAFMSLATVVLPHYFTVHAGSIGATSSKLTTTKRVQHESNEGWFSGLDLLLLLAWLLVEVALPASFFLAYRLVRNSLHRVSTHGRTCQGRPGRALVHGVFWASGYAMPLAMLVLVLHRFVRAF